MLQALSLAGGLGPTPGAQKLQDYPAHRQNEIPVDVKNLVLEPDDIWFVPSSVRKKAAMRSVEAVIQAATGVAIWRR